MAAGRVLVTGAASGIGLATARHLAAGGVRVALADLNRDALADAAGALGAPALLGDISAEDDAERLVTEAAAALDGLDGLVNAAGIGETPGGTLRQQLADWQRVIDVDLRGVWLMCRAAGRLFVPRRGGAIVNIASIAGMAPAPASNAYAPAKAGVIMLTRSLAAEWGARGVRVNAIAPGLIDTPLARRLTRMTEVIDAIPMARAGRPEEIAEVAAFLLSDAASYVTGVTLPVDGGWTAYGAVATGGPPPGRIGRPRDGQDA